MTGHTEIVWAVAFVSDGDEIVSGSNDHLIRVWNGAVGQPISTPMRGHEGPVTSVAISPHGDRIASAGADKTVRLWDPETGKPIAQPLRGHTGVVTSVAFGRKVMWLPRARRRHHPVVAGRRQRAHCYAARRAAGLFGRFQPAW